MRKLSDRNNEFNAEKRILVLLKQELKRTYRAARAARAARAEVQFYTEKEEGNEMEWIQKTENILRDNYVEER